MSGFSDLIPPNPYEPTRSTPAGSMPYATASVARPMPVFCLVVFIIDLVLLGLRAMLVLLGFVGLQAAAGNPMVRETGVAEIATGAAMVLLGVSANVAMLARQSWGVYLAYLKVLATLGSCGVGIWQLTIMLQQFPEGSAERVGAMVGAAIAMMFRVALVVVYVTAVIMFSKWAAERAGQQIYGTEYRP